MLPIYIHTVNLVRWFALFRNNGEYNKDTYQSSITQIFKLKRMQKKLLHKAQKFCPNSNTLKHILERKMAHMKNVGNVTGTEEAAGDMVKMFVKPVIKEFDDSDEEQE